MRTRLVPVALVAALATSVAPLGVAHADGPAPDPAPVITSITSENSGGGLTPYLPLVTSVVVSFTDTTPSADDRYQVQVPELGRFEAHAADDDPTHFTAHVPTDSMTQGETYSFHVDEEDADGTVVDSAAPSGWTYRVVGHPSRLSTSSRKVRGQWSYRAGRVARFSFRGTWEPGTRISSQVWVSRTRAFRPDDWTYNTTRHGALVERYDATRPVLSVRIPRRLVGKYVWVSFRGTKPGKAGWLFTVEAEKVVR